MAKINIRESLGRLDILTDNKYDLRNTYDSSNISNDKKRMLAESISNNASAKQLYSILNESFEEPGVNVTEEMSDTIRTGMLSGMVGNDIWEVFFESGPTDVLDSDLEDISDAVFDGKLSGKTSRGIGWQIRVGYNDDYYDYNCLNCPEDDYVGSRWEEYDESLTEDIDAKYCAEIYDREDYDEFEDEIVRLGRTGYICTNDLDEFIDKVQKEVKNGKYVNIKDRDGEYTQLMMKYSYYDCDDEIVDDIYHALGIDVPLYKIVCVNDEFDDLDVDWVLVNALSHDDAEKVAEHFGYKWTEDGLDWDMVIEEDNESRDRRYLNNNYDQIGKISVYGESLKESASDSDEYEREHIIRLAKAVKEASKGADERKLSNLKKTAKKYLTNHKGTKHEKEYALLQKAYDSLFNESLTEANYGGAYDIDPEMFWTKDDLIEFSDAVCEKLADKFGYQYDIADVGAENNNDMYVTIMDTTHDIEEDVSFRIKMSRIHSPRDLMKYLDTVVSQFVKKFEEEYQYYEFDESLNEAIDVRKAMVAKEFNYVLNYAGESSDVSSAVIVIPDVVKIGDKLTDLVICAEDENGKVINFSSVDEANDWINKYKDTANFHWERDELHATPVSNIEDESLTEDTVKQNGKWVNKGKEGTHGKFKTKKAADAQRKAMFANGYKGESFEDKEKNESYIPDDADVKKDMVMFTAMVHKGDAWDEALYNLGYVCDDPGCTTWTKSVSDGDIVVIIEPNDDEYTIENSTIYCSKLDNNGNVVYEKSFNIFSDEWLNEDWEPDEWEETDFLDDDGKKAYINIIKEAEDMDDLRDIAMDLYWHDKGLYAMLTTGFPKYKPFEWVQQRMIDVIKSTMNESLTEASYGGAYDIEDDMYFTKEEIVDLAYEVCNLLKKKFGYDYDIEDVYMNSHAELYMLIIDVHNIEAECTTIIDMRKIRKPSDLYKYSKTIADRLSEYFEEAYQEYEFDESFDSLNEDISKKKFLAKAYKWKDRDLKLPVDGILTDDPDEFFKWVMKKVRGNFNIKMKNMETSKTYRLVFYSDDDWQDGALKLEYGLEAILGKDELKRLTSKYKNESLTEDVSKPDFVVGFYAGPTDEETLEITNPKKLMDVEVSASELKKEYSNVEKLLGDYTSQTADKLKDENHQSYLKSLILSFAERKARESGKLDKAFRDEQRKFSDADVSMDIKIEEVNYPFEDGIKKLSKHLGRMLLPKRENLKEDMSAVMDDFAYARRNWDRIGTGVSLDDALEEYNAQYGQEGFYARPLYSESEWNKMVNMFADVETITEAVDDEVDFDTESDFGDGSVEEGDTFIEDGRTWSWIERIAGPIHLDFDNWAVWSARDWDYIQEKIRPILLNKEELTVETLTKIYDEAEVAYFVVDEDTGFIDWGPVETQTEAQDFLNGKVEDWENDGEYNESLKENKNLKESWTMEFEYGYETKDGYDTYTYEADGDDVVDYITDRMYGDGEYPDFLEGQSDEEIEDWLSKKENYQKFKDWVEENIYDLLKRYEDDVYEYFREQSEMEYEDELNDYDNWKLNSWSRYDNGSGMTDKDFL